MPPQSDADVAFEPAIAEVQQKQDNTVSAKYVCHICQAKFKRLDQLDRHVYHHTGIKTHICFYDDCDKAYSILTHLKRHLRSTHERNTSDAQKTVRCKVPDCEKLFQSVSSMQRHIREVHENPKLYFCSFCNEKFRQKLKMRRHEINKHTGEYPYNCHKCHKGFYLQYQHDSHLSICKIYNCANCQLVFNKWSVYQKHCRETQHGRKYHKCTHCTRIYAKPGELQEHIFVKHSQEGGETSEGYQCPETGCPRFYLYLRNLRHHMRVAHAGERFKCMQSQCNNVFTSAQNLRKHMQREHQQQKVEGVDKKLIEKRQKSNNAGQSVVSKKRKKRKDAGQSVVSQLSKMSGLAVTKDIDQLLRVRDKEGLQLAAETLAIATSKQQIIEKQMELDALLTMALQEYS